jgi:hypothetical protein
VSADQDVVTLRHGDEGLGSNQIRATFRRERRERWLVARPSRPAAQHWCQSKIPNGAIDTGKGKNGEPDHEGTLVDVEPLRTGTLD